MRPFAVPPNSGLRWFCALCCLLATALFPRRALAAPPVALGAAELRQEDVSSRIDYLVDPGGKLSLKAARASAAWTSAQRAADLNFGYRQGAVWLRLQVQNDSDRQRDLRLEIGLAQIDQVVLYVAVDGGEVASLHGGDSVSDADRALPYYTPTFPITLPKGARSEAWARVESTSSLSLGATLSDAEAFVLGHARTERTLGGLFGLLIGLLIYHLAFAVYSRDRNFLWYSVQTVAMLAYVVTVTGIGGGIWGGTSHWARAAPGIVIALCGPSIAQYMRFHLETASTETWADRSLRRCVYVGLGVAVLAVVLPPRLSAQVATVLVALTVLVVVVVAATRWNSSQFAARPVLLIWGGVLVTVFVASGAAIGAGVPLGSARNLLMYAIMAERLAMAIPLGARVRELIVREAAAKQAAEDANARALKESEERATTELALLERDRQLAQSQKLEALGLLAGGVAHDFNNVLQVVLGCANLLEDELGDRPAQRALLRDMAQAARQAAGLTRQLLVFSRKQVMRPEAFDLNDLVSDMRNMITRAVGSSIDVKVEVTPETLPIYADRGQLEQALLNLSLNAGDAMEGGGTLTIRTRRVTDEDRPSVPEGQVPSDVYGVLEVQDTGVGMSESLREYVFEPFFTTKEAGRGTGLGLSMVKAAVERNEGLLSLSSEQGKGTTFRLYFPLDDAAANREPVRSARSAAPGRDVRILLVEDHPQIRALSRRNLATAGFHVLVAGDGDAALGILQDEKVSVDLVVSDVVMPGLTGWRLLEEARKIHADLPFIFCSGYSPDFVEKRVSLDAATRLLPKPFEPEELILEVDAILEKPRSRGDASGAKAGS